MRLLLRINANKKIFQNPDWWKYNGTGGTKDLPNATGLFFDGLFARTYLSTTAQARGK